MGGRALAAAPPPIISMSGANQRRPRCRKAKGRWKYNALRMYSAPAEFVTGTGCMALVGNMFRTRSH
eukprot:gene14647-biopygen20115